jgi:predicted DCC family thiol-disulfide oxidoreductase YuxK
MKKEIPIVFYDGDCGFCNKTVQFILKNEKNQNLHFAAIQSEFSQCFFESNRFPKPDLSTFYYWNGSELFSKSTAALHLLDQLKSRFHVLKIGYILPKIVRDKMYDFIAQRRHKIANGFCVIPSSQHKKRFIE